MLHLKSVPKAAITDTIIGKVSHKPVGITKRRDYILALDVVALREQDIQQFSR